MKNLFNKIYFFVKYIVPVFVVMGIIFYLSNQPSLGNSFSNPLENVLRKGAHFTEYGILTFFLWRFFYNGLKIFSRTSFWLVLILAVLFAISDEWHQSFVDGRHGSPIDVIIDFFSVFIILQVILIFIKRRLKKVISGNIILMLGGAVFLSGIVGVLVWQSYKIDKKIMDNKARVEDIDNRELDSVRDSIKSSTRNNNEVKSPIESILNIEEEKNSRNQNYNSEDNLPKEIKDKRNSKTDKKVVSKVLPKKVLNKVLFMTQSPFAKWDQLHEEACEEASLIMLKYYNDVILTGKKPGVLPVGEAEKEIQKLVKYQIKKYGDFYDTDVKTTKEIGEGYYKLNNLKIIEDFTIADLKKELAQGNIILVPTAGRELKNPNFTPPGPLYHNLVITGYDDTINSKTGRARNTFITNDPGTRRGENYEYNQQLLYNAIHDFPGDVNKILRGSKRAIVLEKFPLSKIQDTRHKIQTNHNNQN